MPGDHFMPLFLFKGEAHGVVLAVGAVVDIVARVLLYGLFHALCVQACGLLKGVPSAAYRENISADGSSSA